MRTIKSSKPASSNIIQAKTYPQTGELSITPNEPFQSNKKLNPSKFGRIINSELSEEEIAMANDPNVKPFSRVSDSAQYVRNIRKTTKP